MARTVEEIRKAALVLPKDGALTVDLEEATLLVKQHQASRASHGKAEPEFRYVMKKLKGGRAQIHGRRVSVKE